jgi:hypothetical protein
MSFEEFQNQAGLYVLGAMDLEELEEFETARKNSGKRRKIASRNITHYMKHSR